MGDRQTLEGRDAELAAFGVRLPDEPLEAGPMPFYELLERERRAERGREASDG